MSHGIVILAAGASTRLGRPKQLLNFDGKTLLRRAAETALATNCRPVSVVTRSGAEALAREISSLPVQIVVNSDWDKGIGTSIRAGVKAIAESGLRPEAVVLMLCDQPLVTATAIDKLVRRWSASGKPICAASYSGTIGTPAVFAASLFAELLNLADSEGGKAIISRHACDVETMELAEAAMDVDTETDFLRLEDSLRRHLPRGTAS